MAVAPIRKAFTCAIWSWSRLKDMIREPEGRGKAPDFWVSGMAPTPKRMEPAGEGGAKVNVYIVSCPVEGEDGAVKRTYRRAMHNPMNQDFNRFMPTKELLKNHRKATIELPGAIEVRRRDLRLFDTRSDPPSLTATMDSHNREMRIFDPEAFVDFVRKSFIQVNAESENDVYPPRPDVGELAGAMCRYLDADVSLNFRYNSKVPNPIFGDIEERMKQDIRQRGDEIEKLREVINNTRIQEGRETPEVALRKQEQERRKAAAALAMMTDSEPETYLWAGHNRAVVRDFSAFVKAFGPELAQELLIKLGQRPGLLSVRDYAGHQLLLLDDVDWDLRLMSSVNGLGGIPARGQEPDHRGRRG